MKTGTREWGDENRNIQFGCERGCLYCYAREGAMRFKRISTRDEWLRPKINQKALKNTGKVAGVVFFPSTHDITPLNLDYAQVFLADLCANGNRVLVVSKPEKVCIERLTMAMEPYKKQIKFRFTIGSTDDAALKFWEPGAPGFWERIDCLRLAHARGYETSVSCEPYLDDTIYSLVEEVRPLVTDTIWIGLLNRFERRVDTSGWSDNDWAYARKMFAAQTNEAVWKIYERYKDDKKIRFKDSIKKVIGLPEEETG